MSKLRVSADGKELKIQGTWYNQSDITHSINLYIEAKRILGIKQEQTQ